MTQVATNPQKFTDVEQNEFISFIGNAVLSNYVLPASTTFGVNTPKTVQDILNSSLPTVRALGEQVNKILGNFDPDFSSGKEPILGGLGASKWVSFLKMVIRKKLYDEYVRELNAKLANAERTIAETKTTKEKRKDAEQEVAKLKAALA